MAKITKTEEQLTKDLEVVMKKLYKTLPGTPEEKIQILGEKFESIINQLKPKDVQIVNSSKVTQLFQEDFVIDTEATAIQQENTIGEVKTKTRTSAEDKRRIIELAKQGVPQNEIASKVERHTITVRRIISKEGIMSIVKIRALLKERENQEISVEELAARTGVYPETIRRIREKLLEETKNTFQEKETAVEAGTLPIPEGTVKEEVSQHSGGSTEEVLLGKQDDQETTIVVEVHGKEKRDTDLIETSKELVEPNLPEVQNRTLSIQQQIVKFGKTAMEVPEIASRVGVSSSHVSQRLRDFEIWSAAKIRRELKQPGAEKRSDNSWANLAGVDIEAIRRIRDEIRDEEVKDSESIETRGVQKKRTHISKSSSFRSRVSVSRSGKLQIVQEGDATELELEAASPIITYQAQKPEYPKKEQELAEELGIPVRLIKPIKSRLAVYSGIAAIAKEYKVSSKAVERILEIVKKEQYDRTHTEVQYKIKMLELRSTSKRGMKGEIETKVLEYRADTLVTEFTHFLTKEDYAFLAYAYAKARAYQKALDLGEQYLQLETPSLSGLQQRINEVIQEGLSARGEAEKIEELKFEGDGR